MKAEDILFVMNDLVRVDLSLYEFGVITRKGPGFEGGLELGEVVILEKNTGGREPEWKPFPRRLSKWDVTWETFATLEEARVARVSVLSGGTS